MFEVQPGSYSSLRFDATTNNHESAAHSFSICGNSHLPLPTIDVHSSSPNHQSSVEERHLWLLWCVKEWRYYHPSVVVNIDIIYLAYKNLWQKTYKDIVVSNVLYWTMAKYSQFAQVLSYHNNLFGVAQHDRKGRQSLFT